MAVCLWNARLNPLAITVGKSFGERQARRHDVNANQGFQWRKLYREGRLGDNPTTKLLPVRVADERVVGGVERDGNAWPSGTIEIQLGRVARALIWNLRVAHLSCRVTGGGF
jgi:hypothetical protein